MERKKTIKWCFKMFRILLSITFLNCMIICCANWVQFKIAILDSEWVWYSLWLLNMAVKLKGKCKAIISVTKIVQWLLERLCLKIIPTTEEKAKSTKRPVACYKQQKNGDTVLVPWLLGWSLHWRLFQDIPYHAKLLR